jgi:hypothetical protein
MSNLPQQFTYNQYVADGSTTIYNYTYLLPLNSDINVYVTLPGQPAIPDADIQVLGVDYTVQGVGQINGGTITFTVAPVLDAIITFQRNVQSSIDTEFVNTQTINGINLDNAFLREMLVIQQNTTDLQQRVLRYAVDSFLPNIPANTTLPVITNIDNQVWVSQGGTIVPALFGQGGDVGTLRSQLASMVPFGNGAHLIGYFDTFNLVGTQVDAFLNSLPDTINAKFVQNQLFTDTGAANAITLTFVPTYATYLQGTYVRVKLNHTNTSPTVTLNINGLGALPVLQTNGVVPAPGMMITGGIYEFVIINAATAYLLNPSQLSYGATAYSTIPQSFVGGSGATRLNLDTVVQPLSLGANIFDSSISAFRPKLPGRYRLSCNIQFNATGASANTAPVLSFLYVNGAPYTELDRTAFFGSVTPSADVELVLAGTEFLQLYINNTAANTVTLTTTASNPNNFQIDYLGNYP